MNETLEKQAVPAEGGQETTPSRGELLDGYRSRLAEIKIWVDLGHGTADDQRLIEELEGKIRNLEGQK